MTEQESQRPDIPVPPPPDVPGDPDAPEDSDRLEHHALLWAAYAVKHFTIRRMADINQVFGTEFDLVELETVANRASDLQVIVPIPPIDLPEPQEDETDGE